MFLCTNSAYIKIKTLKQYSYSKKVVWLYQCWKDSFCFTVADTNLVMVIVRKGRWVIRRWEKWAELTPLSSCVLWDLRHILTHLQYYVWSLNSLSYRYRPARLDLIRVYHWIGLEKGINRYMILFFKFLFWIFEKTSKFWAATYKNESNLLLVSIESRIISSYWLVHFYLIVLHYFGLDCGM